MTPTPKVRPRHILAGIGVAAAIWLTQGIVPLELWLLVGGLVVAGIAIPRLAAGDTAVASFGSHGEMRDNLAPIQTFLEDRDGHYRFDIWNHDDTIKEDTLEKDLGGNKQEFYAVIGARYCHSDQFPRLQLFVWNETKNKKHAYYRDVQNEDLQHDPLYRHYKRRFLKAEGRADPDRDEPWTGANINIDQSPPGQRGD